MPLQALQMARRPTLRSIRFDPAGLANSAYLRPRVRQRVFRSEALNEEGFCYSELLLERVFAK